MMADENDEMMNNLIAAGALWMSLSQAGLVAEPVMVDGNATNSLVVRFHFLKSPYRITVERIDEEASHVYVDSGGGDCEVCGRYSDDPAHDE